MINTKQLFLTLILSIPMLSFAAPHMDETLTYLKDIETLDCNTQGLECRYYSALEIISYYDACPLAFSQITNTVISEPEKKQMEDWLNRWTFLSTPQLKMSIINDNNMLRKYLAKQTLDMLSKEIPSEVTNQCGRMAIIINNENPDIYSELLKNTKNYEVWLHNQSLTPFQFNKLNLIELQ